MVFLHQSAGNEVMSTYTVAVLRILEGMHHTIYRTIIFVVVVVVVVAVVVDVSSPPFSALLFTQEGDITQAVECLLAMTTILVRVLA